MKQASIPSLDEDDTDHINQTWQWNSTQTLSYLCQETECPAYERFPTSPIPLLCPFCHLKPWTWSEKNKNGNLPQNVCLVDGQKKKKSHFPPPLWSTKQRTSEHNLWERGSSHSAIFCISCQFIMNPNPLWKAFLWAAKISTKSINRSTMARTIAETERDRYGEREERGKD